MADTTSTTAAPSVKKYYDYAQEAIDEQALLDKYNAATVAQFNAQREQNRQNENNFYNQMYNTQKTAMDTIRQSNAAAVASGASRGVQAAQELSSLLGLQQESVASATELAQANRQTAQEETAAVLENVLNAYQQATQQRQQLVQQGIESASVDVQQEANEAANKQAEAAYMQAQAAQAQADATTIQNQQMQRDALQSAAKEGNSALFMEMSTQGKDYSKEYSTEGEQVLNYALNNFSTEYKASKDKTGYLNNFMNSLDTNFGVTKDQIYNKVYDRLITDGTFDPKELTHEDFSRLLLKLDKNDPISAILFTTMSPHINSVVTDIYRNKTKA